MTQFDIERFEAEVTKQYGEEALAALDKRATLGQPGTFIPTGSISLDRAIGIGGFPKGRVVEIFGPESTGKTTLAANICANAQAADPNAFVFYADSENAVNPPYFVKLGVDLSGKRFRMAQTNEVEQAMNLTLKACQFGAAVAVVDSVPTLQLEDDFERDNSTEERVGGIAKSIRAALKKIVKVAADTGTCVILINHITYKVGRVFGNPETTPGGTGPKFYASLRLDVRNIGGAEGKVVDEETGEVIGIKTKVKCVKNKVGTPLKEATYDLVYGVGIDGISDLATVAIDSGAMTKEKGAWVSFKDKKFNGKKQLTEALRKDAKLAEAVRKAIYSNG